MSACGCPCCDCDCSDCLPPPTPEELAAEKAREEERLAARWTPARNLVEQLGRDMRTAEEIMCNTVALALYGKEPGRSFSGGLWMTLEDE